MSVKGTATFGTFAIGASNVTVSANVSTANSVTFMLYPTNVTWDTTPTFQFEQSTDGVTWAMLPVLRTETGLVGYQHTIPGSNTSTLVFEGSVMGATYVQVRVVNAVGYSACGVIIQPSTTTARAVRAPVKREQLIFSRFTNPNSGEAVVAPAASGHLYGPISTSTSSFSLPAGKRLRITSASLHVVSNLTTAGYAKVALQMRYNPSGATVVASPRLWGIAAGVAATMNQTTTTCVTDMNFDLIGSATTTFGFTLTSTHVQTPAAGFVITGYITPSWS